MKIDGNDYGTSSVSKGLARHKMAKGAKESSDKAAHPQMPNEDGGGGEAGSQHDHAGQEGGHEAIQQAVTEHGPAKSVEVSKEGENHTVKTMHEDGHSHESKGHPTVSHVHEHIGHAAGNEQAGHEDMGEGAEGADSLSAMGIGGE